MSIPENKNQQAQANTTPTRQVTQAKTDKDPFAFMAQIQTKLMNKIQQNDKKSEQKIEKTNAQMKQMKQKIKILIEQIQKIKKDRDHLKQKLKQAHQKLQIAQKLLFEKDITQSQLKKELEQLKETLSLRKKQQKAVNGHQSSQEKSQNKQRQERYKILSQKVKNIQKEKQQAELKQQKYQNRRKSFHMQEMSKEVQNNQILRERQQKQHRITILRLNKEIISKIKQLHLTPQTADIFLIIEDEFCNDDHQIVYQITSLDVATRILERLMQNQHQARGRLRRIKFSVDLNPQRRPTINRQIFIRHLQNQ